MDRIHLITSRAILVSILAGTFAASACAQWTTVRPMQLPRQETCAAMIGDTVYVCGGIISGPPTVNTATVEAYHAKIGLWTSIAPMPLALDHAGAAALNGQLYVMGGVTRSGGTGTARSEMHIYDPTLDSWSAGTPLPQPRSAPWSVALNGKIYVIGGSGPPGGARTELYAFDPTSNLWTELAPMTEAREHLNAVTDGTYLYVIGGRVGGTSTTTNERYDPGANTWTTLTPMPTARAAMAMAVVSGEIHCMGGETPMLFDAHEVYDIGSNTWSTLGPMAIPRHGVAAVTLPSGGILVAAGGIVQGLGPTAHTDIYGPLPPAVPATSGAMLMLLGIIVIALSLAATHRRRSRNTKPLKTR